MSILYVLIPLALLLLGVAVWAFFWAVGNGQFDDLDTPAVRSMLVLMLPLICGIVFAKAMLNVLGLEVGRCRLPLVSPNEAEMRSLRQELNDIGFFAWAG